MKSCPSHKNMYVSEQLAVQALIEAHIHFNFRANQGPIAVYQCEDCGYYHLTSKGHINPTLERYMQDSTLKKLKQASEWEKKWRR